MNQLSETLPALPSAWTEKLFTRLTTMYGNKFLDMWKGLDLYAVKQAWAEDLAGFSGEEIKRGLDWCKTQAWPPTLPEFMTACRHPIDPKTDWAEACEQMRIRLQGNGGDVWSRPQVYWAAVSIGWYDLNQTPWEQIKARWMNALENASTQDIPEYKAALPKPGQTTTTREDAAKRLREIAKQTGVPTTPGTPGIAWARRLAEREASGEAMSIIQKRMWRDALGANVETSARDALVQMEKAA